MNELIERFRYRFELWRRERREDLYGLADGPVVELHNKNEAVPLMAFRYVGALFSIIIIISGLSRLIGRHFPTARFAIGVVAVCVASFFGLAIIVAFVQEWNAKRKASADASTPSNQSLERTADRRDNLHS